MKIRHYIFIGLFFLLVAVLFQAPARLVLYLVPEGVRLQVGALDGTVWQGKGQNVFTVVNGQHLFAETLSWQLKPISLFRLAPAADIELQADEQRAHGRVVWLGGHDWRLQEGEFTLPARVVGDALLDKSTQNELSGQLSVRVHSLQVERNRIQKLTGQASWQAARWFDGSHWNLLGNFAADLKTGSNGDVLAQLFDLNGPVSVSGTLGITLSRQIEFQGDIGLRENAPKLLHNILPVFGEQQSNGKYRVTIQTSIQDLL